jgi:hypothetical protein
MGGQAVNKTQDRRQVGRLGVSEYKVRGGHHSGLRGYGAAGRLRAIDPEPVGE